MTKIKGKPQKDKGVRLKRLTINPYMRGTTVYLKLFHNGKSIAFSTGLTCRPAQLNHETFEIEGDEAATNMLQSIRSDIQRTYSDFIITKRHPDLREIRDVALNHRSDKSDIPTLIQCLEKYLKEEFESLEGIEYEKKTVDKKRYLVDRIKQYIIATYGNRFLKMSDLRPIDGQSLVNFCKKTFGHGHNHAVLHAEFLKRTLNYAIQNEWIEKNPLAFFRPKRERKAVVALKEADINKLENTVFIGREYNYVKDVFLFCCYTGLAYVDVSNLNSTHLVKLQNGDLLIKINRGKNDNICIIPLIPQAIELIEKYANIDDDLKRGRLFPVFANQVMNRILKEVQAHCGIQIRLTTHVARKTCASFFIANGVPLTSVATMLGHKKTSTTEQYYTQRSEEAVIQHINEFKNRKKAN